MVTGSLAASSTALSLLSPSLSLLRICTRARARREIPRHARPNPPSVCGNPCRVLFLLPCLFAIAMDGSLIKQMLYHIPQYLTVIKFPKLYRYCERMFVHLQPSMLSYSMFETLLQDQSKSTVNIGRRTSSSFTAPDSQCYGTE